MPINFTTRKEYTGQNQITLHRQYASNEWGTFLQWKGAGFQVKRGTHGTKIVKVIEYTDSYGKKKVGPRFYTVFNREQVEPIMQMVNQSRLMAVR